MTRLAGVLAGALLLVAVTAPPAAAHTRASSATNFDSRIERAPALPGVSWRVYPGGEYVEATNSGEVDLLVLGYDGEPYLRIGPGGVQRNRNSPATYLNLERYADVAVPPRADPGAPPDWEQVSAAPTYAWHDHRVHWMSPSPPAAVAADPGTRRTVGSWTLPFVHGGRAHEVAGTLVWDPGPPWWPWVLAGLVLTAPAAVGLRRGPRQALRGAAVVVAAVAVANLAHLPDEVAALPVPALDVAFGLLHNLLFIGAGVAGAALTWRRAASVLPLAIGSAAVLFHQGLLQVANLGNSQLATVWPPALVRMLVALGLAQAVWVLVVTTCARKAPQGGQPPARAQPPRERSGTGTSVPAEPVLSAPDNA